MTGPLELDRDAIAALGREIAVLLTEHAEGMRDRPVGGARPPEELARALPELGDEPSPPADTLRALAEVVRPNIVQQDHPRYFATVPSPGNPVAAFADALAAGLNVFAGNWSEGSAAGAVEVACLEWLRELCGLPHGASGLFVSGGTIATLTALVTALRERVGEPDPAAVLYTSEEAHSSVARAAMVAGLRRDHVVLLPVDEQQRLRPAELREAVAADRARGRRPFALVATAGSTSTAAIDPLGDLADVCAAEGLWLHVDAAYGGGALLAEPGRRLLAGIERADSITLDPHKWLFQPFGLGCLLVRDPATLERTFRLVPDYLEELAAHGDVDFYDRGIEVSRPFRALRLWLSLRVFGVAAFRSAVERGFELARTAADEVERSERLELVTGPRLSVVCFAPTGAESDASDAVARALAAEGRMAVGCTRVGGRRVLRMCTINPRTENEDVRATVRRLDALAGAVRPDRPGP